MSSEPEISLLSRGDRFARLEAIPWWDQARLRDARVLVIGAGALGNEVLKNLALLGVGRVVVADMDTVEESNLCRSVLFREADNGLPKAACAARAAVAIYGDARVHPLVGNVLADVGLGYFRWADVVVGALDNREARVFVNSACAQLGRPWVDGGIDVLSGVARVFAPPEGSCYECTMGQSDWNLLNVRRSCSLLARNALRNGGAPTTPTAASIIGAVQVQEVMKLLHGRPALNGGGFMYDGQNNDAYHVTYPISPECPWHGEIANVESLDWLGSRTPIRDAWDWAQTRLGGLDALDLSRELIQGLDCPVCGVSENVFQSIECVTEDLARCPSCGSERVPLFFHSIDANSKFLDRAIGELGVPSWDIIWARFGDQCLGMEMSADNPLRSM